MIKIVNLTAGKLVNKKIRNKSIPVKAHRLLCLSLLMESLMEENTVEEKCQATGIIPVFKWKWCKSHPVVWRRFTGYRVLLPDRSRTWTKNCCLSLLRDSIFRDTRGFLVRLRSKRLDGCKVVRSLLLEIKVSDSGGTTQKQRSKLPNVSEWWFGEPCH